MEMPVAAVNWKIKGNVRGNLCLFEILKDRYSRSTGSDWNPNSILIRGEGKGLYDKGKGRKGTSVML